MEIFLVSFSCVFQILTALIALYTIRITGARLSWIMISSAAILMGVRRILSLLGIMDNRLDGNIDYHVAGLAISVLLFFGTLGIRSIFADWNITKKRNEELLDQKRILLKEVHHRIKNNITSISQFLKIQADKEQLKESKMVLLEATSRVDGMKLLYNKLLISDNYGTISTNNYITELIDSIISLFPDKEKICLNVEIDNPPLDIQTLINLGSIINEIVTNSVKYGFDGRQTGIIDVSLKDNGSEIILTVSDNGKGFDSSFPDKEKGLGLTLISMLVQQLKGDFIISSENGTKSIIRFTYKQ
ncbi:MAG: sensor histidine kinase [Spirochaetes bacterium]|nr:sensor histidine kinase [Spirochaetota bacterium]MBN2771817.1 sensor histidine kinase [Spirochaetota bacterium]